MRIVDADALKEKIEQSDGEGTIARYCKRVLAECLDNDAPTVDAIPVVHGAWINIPDKPEWDQKACSVCGDYFCCQNNFCPNCGAKMDGERRDENAAD